MKTMHLSIGKYVLALVLAALVVILAWIFL
jgi:hypothetical protein